MRFFPLLLFLMLLTACAERQQLQPLPDGAVILAFGDSLTYGTGAEPETSYPARLQDLTQHPVINAGVPGELSAAGLRRLPALLEQYNPGLLILCHGGNDILRKKSNTETQANLREMIRLGQSHGATVILLGVPKPGIFLKSLDFYNELAAETGVYYLKDLISEVLSDRDLKSDPAHPNASGYAVISSTIAQALKRDGAL